MHSILIYVSQCRAKGKCFDGRVKRFKTSLVMAACELVSFERRTIYCELEDILHYNSDLINKNQNTNITLTTTLTFMETSGLRERGDLHGPKLFVLPSFILRML